MTVRRRLTTASVVDAALALLDEHGADGLTLAAVAARTGVATPSLYKHVASLAELKALVGVRVLEDMTGRFTTAVLGRSGDDAVETLMHEYRAYVREHPRRYAAMPMDPLHDPVLKDAGAKLMEVLFATLRGHGLEGSEAVHATRRLRVVVHGFAHIESSGGFGLPEGLDDTYDQLVRMYLDSLRGKR
ncbi:TetR/AcrR family transcriptional regulator [Nocardia sp. NRRL S-836]|uniref:TetR/AcrR family transcriptional regulator n=1 Tax=Nocardia sp. NRRL S-836 TaxID=1519492 RepID=UPI0006AFF2EF|nr:TetR-like C-terminal domain-containing protein [Nocardia sp. NRRL S-836]KOV79699.1 TetR family transcriptional regulator [Nocardia sp. NRRL S-836]